jgi:hypothetical protein
MNFDIWVFFEKLSKKIRVLLKSHKNKGTLHKDQYTFLIIFRSVLLRMRNVSDETCRGNQNTHFSFSNFFVNRAFKKYMEKFVERGRAQMAILHMRIACWMTKVTHTHTHTHTHTQNLQ